MKNTWRKMTVSLALIGLSYSLTVGAGQKKSDDLAGFTLGEPFAVVRKKLAKRRRTVFVPLNFIDMQTGLRGTKYRCSGPLVRDSGVRNCMLYFSQKGILGGVDLFLKGSISLARYRNALKRNGFTEDKSGYLTGKALTGKYAGAKVTVHYYKMKSGRRRAYILELRCPAILAVGKNDGGNGGGGHQAHNAVGRAL